MDTIGNHLIISMSYEGHVNIMWMKSKDTTFYTFITLWCYLYICLVRAKNFFKYFILLKVMMLNIYCLFVRKIICGFNIKLWNVDLEMNDVNFLFEILYSKFCATGHVFTLEEMPNIMDRELVVRLRLYQPYHLHIVSMISILMDIMVQVSVLYSIKSFIWIFVC